MKWVDAPLLDDLVMRAAQSPRLRQHFNLHSSYADPCQRLLNALWHNSYIAPHRHIADPKEETLVAVRGDLCFVAFDDDGAIIGHRQLGAGGCNVAIVVAPGEWHTVVALSETAVLLEVKAGPFDPLVGKEAAPWAPTEGSPEAAAYLQGLRATFL